MWKRIHSNRDPRDTLLSEIRKEFGSYFGIATLAAGRLFKAYPRVLFGMMVVTMTGSLILSFTVFRNKEVVTKTPENKSGNVQDGFAQIMHATGNIRETLGLKRLVDSLSSKKVLTAHDSTLLDSALDRLSQIHHKLQ